MKAPTARPALRCAIYTRVSTDARLEQEFNSLDAQREASEINLGRFDQAKSDILQAIRLSPRDPGMPLWQTNLADAEMGLGHFDAAIDLIHQSIDAGYRVSYTYRELAAAYALKGKMEDAKTALAEALRLDPTLTVKSVARTNSVPVILDALRKAGLPEE